MFFSSEATCFCLVCARCPSGPNSLALLAAQRKKNAQPAAFDDTREHPFAEFLGLTEPGSSENSSQMSGFTLKHDNLKFVQSAWTPDAFHVFKFHVNGDILCWYVWCVCVYVRCVGIHVPVPSKLWMVVEGLQYASITSRGKVHLSVSCSPAGGCAPLR
eukprot:s2243_g7.t1